MIPLHLSLDRCNRHEINKRFWLLDWPSPGLQQKGQGQLKEEEIKV